MSQSRFSGRQSLLKVNRNRPEFLPIMTRQMVRKIPPSTIDSSLSSPADPSLPLRGRPPKRLKMEQLSVGLRHQQGSSFIMKLFDRSVDLAKFQDESPLYPVCRAWMLNNPRAKLDATLGSAAHPLGAESSRQSIPDIVERYHQMAVGKIVNMPKPIGIDLEPFRLEKPFPEETEKLYLDYADGSAARRDVLMKHHKACWTRIRRNWQRHRRDYGRKYQLSYNLLDAIIMKHAL